MTTYACPVCGTTCLTAKPYERWPPPSGVVLEPPYERQLGRPSYEVCPRCGFEFGNDDNPGTAEPVSFEEYRRAWISDGRPAFDEGELARCAASSLEPYVRLLRAFTRREIGAAEFESLFLALYKEDETDWPDPTFDVLDTLFRAVDESGDDDDAEALRAAAAQALAALDPAGA